MISHQMLFSRIVYFSIMQEKALDYESHSNFRTLATNISNPNLIFSTENNFYLTFNRCKRDLQNLLVKFLRY